MGILRRGDKPGSKKRRKKARKALLKLQKQVRQLCHAAQGPEALGLLSQSILGTYAAFESELPAGAQDQIREILQGGPADPTRAALAQTCQRLQQHLHQTANTLPRSSPLTTVAVYGAAMVAVVAVGIGAAEVFANRVPLTIVNNCANAIQWTPSQALSPVLPSIDVPVGGSQKVTLPQLTASLVWDGEQLSIKALGLTQALNVPDLTSLTLDGASLLGQPDAPVQVGLASGKDHTLQLACTP